jgi:murein DD-endopeptidase MepM/ murein hydrolase activator NlpD
MGTRRLSLILVPGRSGRILRREITYGLLILAGGVALLLFASNLFLWWSFAHRSSQEAKMAKLERENSFLSSELADFRLVIDSLGQEVGELVEREKAIRIVFDLPEVDQDIRQLGIGGRDHSQPLPLRSVWGESFEEVRSGIDRLYRQIRFENESLEYVYQQVTNRKDLLDHTPSIRPCEGYISRGFGMKPDPFTGWMQFHQGMDFAASRGTPVHATACGKVVFTGWSGALGKVVKVDHGFGYQTVFGHLDDVKAVRGQPVKRGQLIGNIGSTGYSTGPHLHYEVRYRGQPIDPRKFIYGTADLVME